MKYTREGKCVVHHQYFESLFTNSPNALIAVDQHFRVFDFNPAAANTFGWSPNDVIGRRCTDLLKCRNLNGTVLCGTSSCPLQRVMQQQQALLNESLLIGSVPS